MSDIIEKFSNRLKAIRFEKGLNQDNMAKLLGLSITGYAKIERGETDVSLTRVAQIASVLKVDIATLLEINNSYIFNNNGKDQYAHVGQNSVIYHQFDKTIMDGLMARQVQYEKELEELNEKMKKMKG